MARGEYKLQVKGALGSAPLTPMALSRDQNVMLKVLTVLDMGVGVAIGLIIAFGLLFYGRPQWLRFILKLFRIVFKFSWSKKVSRSY